METINIIVVFFLFFSGFLTLDAFGEEHVDVMTTKEITLMGLDLTKDALSSDDIESAKQFLDFTSDFFGSQVQTLRTIDPDVVEEIHLSLLDLHTKIDSSDAISKIVEISSLVDSISYDESLSGTVIVNILKVADEQYQIGMQQNTDSSYQIAKQLIQLAENQSAGINFDERLKIELNSFFDDLNNTVETKEDFVKVGNLITAIQKDILGTESTSFEYGSLYQTIYQLYDELTVLVDSGDYSGAEEKAISAYLDNFEYLEPSLEKEDKELLYTLELNMRENLRNMIIDKKSPDEIKLFISEKIIPDLKKSQSLFSDKLQSDPIPLSQELVPDGHKQMGDSTEEQKSGVRNEVDSIRVSLTDVMKYCERGDYQSAYATARTAYLDSYEYVEIPLREIAPDFTLEVEYQFSDLRNLIDDKADIGQIRDVVISINRNLDESERLVSGTGTLAPSIAFMSSFSIIFREGLESVLILGAIITYLEASRNNQLKKYVYYGVLVAFGATAVTWAVAEYIIGISGAHRELVEAVAALSATAVLFYVSFWVLNKIEHKKWMEFVKAKVWQATTTGSVMVFVMLSFFTVYREGFETVLFYQAMSGFAKYMEGYVGLGFLIGIISLLILYFGMKKLGKKLPLRALFGLTMGVGAYLSIAFLGNAVRELQILDLMPYTSMIGTIPRLDINLAKMTGIYPTLETLIFQSILLGVYLLASSYVLIMRPRKEKRLASMRKSRRIVDGK